MNEIAALFVYEHKSTREIRVKYIDDAKVLDGDVSWDHIGTIAPHAYIQGLLREYPALVRKMKGGSV